MESKGKGGLIYCAGTLGFVLFCLALTAAKCVASELPAALYLFPLILYVAWVAYLSGVTFDARKTVGQRILMIVLSAIGACAVIWVCLNLVVPAVEPPASLLAPVPESP